MSFFDELIQSPDTIPKKTNDENPFFDDGFKDLNKKSSTNSNISNENVTNIVKNSDIIQLVNRLRSIGAQIDISLPTIALCGQQSAGKSSLVEAISGVVFPRNNSTCTRCPTELRMIQTSDINFKCRIGIRYEYDDIRGKPLSEFRHKKIGSVTNKKEVCKLVSTAQKILLNECNVKFSRNVITVEIYSKDCIDLTLMDLPGMISAVEDQNDTKYIDLVMNMVLDYIKNDNTLIAAVISCKDDMENQIINTLIKKYDPNGMRSIGILTKVDTIEDGTHGTWVNVLKGNKYPLRLGYIAVKNPSQMELNIKYENARENEIEFFNTKNPWKKLKNNGFSDKLGVYNLIKKLSNTLAGLIEKQLPKMNNIIENKLNKARKELDKLPDAMPNNVNPTELTFDLMVKFTDKVKYLIRNDTTIFWQDIMQELNGYYDRMQKLKPRFTNSKAKSMLNKVANSMLSSNDNSKKKKHIYTLDDVLLIKRKNKRRNIGCARTIFVAESMKEWDTLTRNVINNCSNILLSSISTIINESMGTYKTLCIKISQIINELINELTDKTLSECNKMLKREINNELTLSSSRLHGSYTSALEQLLTAFGIDKNNDKMFEQNEAVNIMAMAVSYYDMCFRRYVDIIALIVDDIMFKEFCDKIDSFIRNRLNLFNANPNTIKSYLMEDKNVVIKRKHLNEQIKRLSNIVTELRIKGANVINNNDNDTLEFRESFTDSKDDKKDNSFSKQRSSSNGNVSNIEKKKKKKKWFGN